MIKEEEWWHGYERLILEWSCGVGFKLCVWLDVLKGLTYVH